MSISQMISGILRQLKRGEILTSPVWNPGGSFKHSNNGDTLVHISHSCAASIIEFIVLLKDSHDPTELHELFLKSEFCRTSRYTSFPS